MFKVFLKKRPEKFLFQVEEKLRVKIIKILKDLETNPRPFKTHDLVKLKGYENSYRIRIGKIRIVYEFVPKEFKIVVHDIDYRGRVY